MDVLSNAEKARILARIQDIEFVDEDVVSDYWCCVCEKVAIYHFSANCKHVFCSKCHGRYFNKPCPVATCRNIKINVVHEERQFELGISNLRVYCLHKIYGCKEIVTLAELLPHKIKCPFYRKNILPKVWREKANQEFKDDLIKLKQTVEEMQAERTKIQLENNELKDDLIKLKQTVEEMQGERTKIQLEKNELKDDLIKVKQTVEEMQGERTKIQLEENKLQEKLIKKVEKQTKTIEELQYNIQKIMDERNKELMEKAIEDKSNPKQWVDAKFSNLPSGISDESTALNWKIVRFSNTLYNWQSSNLSVAQDRPMKQRVARKISYLRVANQSYYDPINYEVRGERKLTVNAVAQNYHKLPTESQDFNVNVFGHNLKCKLENTGIDKFQITLNFNAIGMKSAINILHAEITCKIMDLSSGTIKRDITRIRMPEFGEKQTGEEKIMKFDHDIDIKYFAQISRHEKDSPYEEDLIYESAFCSPNEQVICRHEVKKDRFEQNSRFIRNDSLLIKVFVEPLSKLYETVKSKNGILDWKLEGYTEKRKDLEEGLITSLRSPHFYTSDKGYLVHVELHLSQMVATFKLVFDKGEFDDDLPENFPHKATVTIVNHENSRENVTISHISKETKSYTIGLIAKETIESPTYMHDDCLNIKVIVESSTA